MNLHHRLIPALLLLGTTGCWPSWPRIDGSWSDYSMPEQTDLYAHSGWTVPQGSYWSDNSPSGQVFWGVFDQPQTITGYEILGTDGECVRHGDVSALLSHFDGSGSGSSTLVHHGSSLSLPWSTNSNVFVASLGTNDVEPDTDYDLSQVQFGDYPAFALPGLLHSPVDDFHLDSPAIDGATPGTADLNNLTFTWSGTPADRISALFVTYTGRTQSDQVDCLVEDTGSLTVPASLFPNSANADQLYVFIGPDTFTGGVSPLDQKSAYRASTSLGQLGFLSLLPAGR